VTTHHCPDCAMPVPWRQPRRDQRCDACAAVVGTCTDGNAAEERRPDRSARALALDDVSPTTGRDSKRLRAAMRPPNSRASTADSRSTTTCATQTIRPRSRWSTS
jgi:hypothetical protein